MYSPRSSYYVTTCLTLLMSPMEVCRDTHTITHSSSCSTADLHSNAPVHKRSFDYSPQYIVAPAEGKQETHTVQHKNRIIRTKQRLND